MTSQVLTMQEVEPNVVQITMHDREHKNGFSPQLSFALIEAFAAIEAQPRYRAVILTGYDSYFASGGTRQALLSLQQGQGAFTDTNLYSLPLQASIPVIAAMQGHAIGGGFVFGLFADFVILGRERLYTTNFMKYGFTPGMGATCIVPKKLGPMLGHEMLIAARSYRGEELASRGAPFEVAPHSEVLDRARQLAREVADKPREALVLLKSHLVAELRSLLPGYAAREVEMHAATFASPDVKERIRTLFDG